MNQARSLRLVLCLLLCAGAACGGGGGNGGGNDGDDDVRPTDPGETTLSPTAGPTGQPGAVVGRILQVLDSETLVEGQRIASGESLRRGALLSTDDLGRATFSVLEILEECQIQSGSRLRVAPSPRTPLAVELGTAVCRSKPGEAEFEIPAGQDTSVFLRDPIFVVQVGAGRSTVTVDFGFVEVRRRGQSSGRLVGPLSRLSAGGAGALPARAAAFEASQLDPASAQAVQRLRAGLPPDRPGFPSAAGSQTLAGIREAGEIRAGVDGRASRGSRRFAEAVLNVIADRWEMGTDVESIDHGEASRALANESLDVYVSSEPVPGAARIPLFGDESEEQWFLFARPDGRFQAATEEALKAILNNGQYARAYLGSFERVPTYEAVRSLVYSEQAAAGRTQWQAPADQPETTAPEGEVEEAILTSESPEPGQCPLEVVFRPAVNVDRAGRVEYEFRDLQGQVVRSRSADLTETGTVDLPAEVLEVEESGAGSWQLVFPDQGVESKPAEYEVTCL